MPVPELLPEALAARLASPGEQRPVLLDVRGPEEHDYAALPGSLLIPLHELEERVDEVDALRGREVVVYCHHGFRSLHGAAFLIARGIDARSLAGGIDLWSQQVDPGVPRY